MVIHHWGTKVGQGDFSCNKLVTISPGSATHAGWRGWMERESKMLLKWGTIAYRTTDMCGLISVAQTPRTSALAQVTICPRSAPPRAGGYGGCRGDQKCCWNTGRSPIGTQTCAEYSPSIRRLRPLPSPKWWSVPGLPPRGWIGCLVRGSRVLLKRETIAADGRQGRTVLLHSDSSDLCPLPGALASCQIIQASHPHKCQEWARQVLWWIIRKNWGRVNLGCRGWIR